MGNPHASPDPLTSMTAMRLVGLLLHPIPRSGTWRRLMFSRAADLPLAQGIGQIKPAWRTCRLGGKNRELDNT